MARIPEPELDELRKLNPVGDPRMFRRFLDHIDALEAELEIRRKSYEALQCETWAKAQKVYNAAFTQAVQEKVARAKLEGSFDVLLQIRSFRKRNPMDSGLADTLEFIGNLYYQYEKALAAASPSGDSGGAK